MLRKDKALLESLTKKYGKNYILNEISRETIGRARDEAERLGRKIQTKYFTQGYEERLNKETLSNIDMILNILKKNRFELKEVPELKNSNIGYIYCKGKIIGLYYFVNWKKCHLTFANESIFNSINKDILTFVNDYYIDGVGDYDEEKERYIDLVIDLMTYYNDKECLNMYIEDITKGKKELSSLWTSLNQIADDIIEFENFSKSEGRTICNFICNYADEFDVDLDKKYRDWHNYCEL